MKLLFRCLIVSALLILVGNDPVSRSVSAQPPLMGLGCQKSLGELGDLDGVSGGRGSMDSNSLNCTGMGNDCGGPLVI